MVKRSISPELLEKCKEMRKNPTNAERVLWERLRSKQVDGYKFRRQHPAGGYVLDFYCAAAWLGIELDGGIHRETEQAAYDRQRSEDLAELGVLVLRFWNDEVLSDTERVLEEIITSVKERVVQGQNGMQ